MVGGIQGRRQPVTQPSYHSRWVEDLAIKGDGGVGHGGPLAWGPPVDKFGLWHREGDLEPRGFLRDSLE